MYYDSESPLALRVTDTGTKTFLLYVSHRGRPLKRKIGNFPQMTIEVARDLARQLLSELQTQQVQQSNKVEGAPTVGDLFNRYFNGYASTKRTAEKIKYCFERYLVTRIAAVPACDLTPSDVEKLHAELTREHGPTQANRVIQQLRAIYSYAEKNWLYEGRNPTKAVKLNRENARKRFVEEDELPRLLKAIDQYATPKTRDFFKLCLFTGQRFGNVCRMRWEDINLERSIWIIPASQFKNGEEHQVPLTSAAIEILRERIDKSKNGWVFPSRRGSGHLRSPYRYWYLILEMTGLSDLRIHDLRRTLATYQTDGNTPLRVVGDTLGHRSLSATQIYARTPRRKVHDSMEAAVQKMQTAVHG